MLFKINPSIQILSRTGLVVGSLSVILGLSGCSDYLNNKKSEPQVIEFTNNQFACLDNLNANVKSIAQGVATTAVIEETFDCAKAALTYFNKKTFGSIQDAYTPKDIRNLFGKYFLKENNFSVEFSQQIMHLKQILLGGSDKYLTKVEVNQIIEILDILKVELKTLSPHVQTLTLGQKTPSAKVVLSNRQIEAATKSLNSTLKNLLLKTEILRSEFSFEDIQNILLSIFDLSGSRAGSEQEIKLKNDLQLLDSVRQVFFGKRAYFKNKSEWVSSIDSVTGIFNIFLKFNNMSDGAWNPKKVDELSLLALQAIDLLQNSHQMKNGGYIPLEYIDALLVKLLTPAKSGISHFSINKTYKIVLMKMLDPLRQGDIRTLQGIQNKHLATLRREIKIWRMQQRFIDGVFSRQQLVVREQLRTAFTQFKISENIDPKTYADPFERKALEQAWAGFGKLIRSPQMVQIDEGGRLVISTNAGIRKINWSSMMKFNLMNALSRFLMIGYGKVLHTDVNQMSLESAGLSQWYEDFNEIGLSLKAFDPRTKNAGARSFLEANFFTFSGNGDDKMDFAETFEFVSLLFSSGLASSAGLYENIKGAGCATSGLDVMGMNYFSASCAKNQMKKDILKLFPNIPVLSHFIHQMNQSQWDAFYGYILNASLTEDQRDGLLEIANIRSMVTIMHYIETVMVLYDRDQFVGLSIDEVFSAAPRFMSFFKKVGPTQNNLIVKQGFAYLVFKGKIPTARELLMFQGRRMMGLGVAGRMEIARLFGTLKDQLNKL